MHVRNCRDLEEQAFLVKVERHTHNVGTPDRSGAVVEPYLSTQWFVKMQPMAEAAIEAAKTGGKLNFVPIDWKRLTLTGLRIFVIGVFHVNCGGATVFLLGTVRNVAKL